MKKFVLFFVLIFLLQKSFAQSCNTTIIITPPISCGNACTDTVTFFAAGGTPPYDLVVVGGPTVQFTSTYTWVNVCPGSYFYTVTDASLSCQDTGTITPVFVPFPLLPFPTTADICLGGSVLMCAAGADTYLWSPATALSSVTDTCPTANPTQTTVYTVVGTNNSTGCTSSTMLTVVVNPPPAIAMQVTNATCGGCYDGAITVTPACCTYLWSDTSMTHTNLAPGAYTVVVADANGCVNTASAIVAVGNCSASFTMYPTGNPHDYWVVNNSTGALPLQYDWDWGDGSPHDIIAFPTHTYASAGIYNIVLTINDAVGCTNMQTLNSYLSRMEQMLTITVLAQLPTAALESFEDNIFIYPNPVSNELRIENGEWKIKLVEIYNVIGEKIYFEKLLTGNRKPVTVEVSQLNSGIYFVTITNEEGNKVIRKVVKL
jgi:PKD repeat protein